MSKPKKPHPQADILRPSASEYRTFLAATGKLPSAIEILHEDENIWVTQKMIATHHDFEFNSVDYHLKIIFKEQELGEDSVIRNYRTTESDSNKYNTTQCARHCSLASSPKNIYQKAQNLRQPDAHQNQF